MQSRPTVNVKTFAIIAVVVFVLSIIPILVAAFFNHAAADDLSLSEQAFITWKDTGSFTAIINIAWDNVVGLYKGWLGTYTSVFLITLQPGLFGDDFYCISTFVLMFGLVFSVLFLSKTLLCDYLGSNVWQWLAISIPPLAVCIQTMSNGRDSFFWYSGAVNFTFAFSMYLTVLALILKLIHKSRLITIVAIGVLGLVTAGGAIPVAMLCFLTGIIVLVVLFTKKHSSKYYMLFAVIPMLVGSLLNVFAPGNMVRKAFVEANPGNYGSVPIIGVPFMSAVYGGYTLFLTMSASFIFVMVLILPILRQIISNSKFRFSHPVLISIFSFLLIVTLYLPLTYGNGLILIDRYINIVQITIWILGVINTFYWLGWAMIVKNINFNFEIKRSNILLCVIAAFAIGSTAKINFWAEPGGRGSFTVSSPFSAVIIYEFLVGNIQTYDNAYNNLLTYMESEETQPPNYGNLPNIVPSIFVRPFSHNEADDFKIEWFAARMSNRYKKLLPIPD